jgi:hypothetical protein
MVSTLLAESLASASTTNRYNSYAQTSRPAQAFQPLSNTVRPAQAYVFHWAAVPLLLRFCAAAETSLPES